MQGQPSRGLILLFKKVNRPRLCCCRPQSQSGRQPTSQTDTLPPEERASRASPASFSMVSNIWLACMVRASMPIISMTAPLGCPTDHASCDVARPGGNNHTVNISARVKNPCFKGSRAALHTGSKRCYACMAPHTCTKANMLRSTPTPAWSG